MYNWALEIVDAPRTPPPPLRNVIWIPNQSLLELLKKGTPYAVSKAAALQHAQQLGSSFAVAHKLKTDYNACLKCKGKRIFIFSKGTVGLKRKSMQNHK